MTTEEMFEQADRCIARIKRREAAGEFLCPRCDTWQGRERPKIANRHYGHVCEFCDDEIDGTD